MLISLTNKATHHLLYIYIQNHTVVNLEQSIYDLNYKNKKNL